MRYKLLGRSGLRVSELCLGTMTFGEEWGWGASEEECRKIYTAYREAGGNFVDTANRYTEGTSEKLVGKFMADEREKIVLATKYTLFTTANEPNSAGNHRKNMVQSLEASLKRLNTDYIDLYWVHAWDFMTPVEEVLRGLDDMVRAGKILYIGISDTPAWVVSMANVMAELRGWTAFVGLQIEYSLIERTPERDLLPMARALDIAVTPWAALGGGLLTGKFTRGDAGKEARLAQQNSVRLSEKNLAIAREVDTIADEIGCPSSHVAINWTRQQPGVIVPIIGARTADQIKENVTCLQYPLNNEQMTRLENVSQIELGFPHDFLAQSGIRYVVYGNTYSKIDNHHRR